MELEPIGGIQLGQYSLEYDDLPFKESSQSPIDGKIYRSKIYPKYIFVYHKLKNEFDCFVHL